MADSAPATAAQRQRVGAHHRIGMRRVALLALPRPAAATAVVAAFLLFAFFISTSAAVSAQVRYNFTYILLTSVLHLIQFSRQNNDP